MSLNYQEIRAAIVPIQSFDLTIEESQLFEKYKPLGYILFSRNYQNPAQLRRLTDSLKEASGRDDILILIDQEGERVSRLKEPHFKVLPNAIKYNQDAKINLNATQERLKSDFALVGKQLREAGVNVNCAPVADIQYDWADPIIGVRSYGNDINTVVALCEAADKGLAESKVQSIIKHIPGHGRALVDSHLELPVVSTDLKTLLETDFKVFQRLGTMKLAMTAHVIFTAIDDEVPVTLSKKVIDFIKRDIAFNGLIITDALDMQALRGDIGEVTQKASAAGCDILLYCRADLKGVEVVLQNSHKLKYHIIERVKSFYCFC